MQPRLSFLTLCVDDLERSLRFYRDGLGLPTDGIIGAEFEFGAVVFIDLQPGLKLALWPRRSLEHDAGVTLASGGVSPVLLSHNVRNKAEVDAVLKQAEAAGGVIVKAAGDAFWGGYTGYFRDPDQHLWEVAWNPKLMPPE